MLSMQILSVFNKTHSPVNKMFVIGVFVLFVSSLDDKAWLTTLLWTPTADTGFVFCSAIVSYNAHLSETLQAPLHLESHDCMVAIGK